MLGLRKKGPSKEFSHTDDCKIVKADPGVKIPWNEVETGLWVAECLCGKQYQHEAPSDRRTRQDPLDPSTSRHAPQCEHRNTTDPAVLRYILNVKDGLDPGYWWVTCLSCEIGWQVWHYAPKSVG